MLRATKFNNFFLAILYAKVESIINRCASLNIKHGTYARQCVVDTIY